MRAQRRTIGVLATVLVLAGFGSTGCGGSDGPKEPLWIGTFLAVQPDGSVMIVASVANSMDPVNLVNDGTVTVNGIGLPKYEEGYLYLGNLQAVPGDPLRLTVKRGITITSSVTLPGKAGFVSPAGGEAVDRLQPFLVEWTKPAVEPQTYTVWVSDDFTVSSLGWTETVDPSQTSVEIGAGMLKAGQSGVTVMIQSEAESSTFEGDSLPGSYFRVSSNVESAAFSTL